VYSFLDYIIQTYYILKGSVYLILHISVKSYGLYWQIPALGEEIIGLWKLNGHLREVLNQKSLVCDLLHVLVMINSLILAELVKIVLRETDITPVDVPHIWVPVYT